jgi:hypothetical protein
MMRYALRRLLILPLTLVLAAVVIALLPVVGAVQAIVALNVVSGHRPRWRALRLWVFAAVYCAGECLRRWRARHVQVLSWYLGMLMRTGAVDQPGGGAVVGVLGVALPGGEGAQEPGPGGRRDRVGPLEGLQALGLGLGGQGGGVGGGQVAQPVEDHLERLLGIGGSGHLVLTSPGACRPAR